MDRNTTTERGILVGNCVLIIYGFGLEEDVEINGVRSYTSQLAGAVQAPCDRVRTLGTISSYSYGPVNKSVGTFLTQFSILSKDF